MDITKDWKARTEAKALLIGHDPRLQKSDDIAGYSLFADYYFSPKPLDPKERRKYGLAEAAFKHIAYVTYDKIKPNEVYITNLCNEALDHAPENKTVYITIEKAKKGIDNIRRILAENSSIEFIFPMSVQVNYWLQKLDFYRSDNDFLENSEPKQKGLDSNPPYYQPLKSGTFKRICGNHYKITEGQQMVIPILHPKNFPLRGKFLSAYKDSYERARHYFVDIFSES